MKKIKSLLLVFSILACAAFAGCSMPSFGSGNSLGIGGGSQGSELPDDSKDSGNGSNSTGGNGGNQGDSMGGKPDDEKPDGGEIGGDGGEEKPDYPDKPSDPNDSSSGGDDSSENPNYPGGEWGDIPDIPEDQIYLDVSYYTIHTADGVPLRGGYLVDENATLNDFFDQYMDEIMRVYNEEQGFEEGNYHYDAQFFKNSFWQVSDRLIESDKVILDYIRAVDESVSGGIPVPIVFTPSGAGLNITIYDGEFDSNPAVFPFPISVCLRDTIDWAYQYGFFDMSYDESIKVGVWQDYWSRMPILDDTWTTELLFILGGEGSEGGEGGWDDPDMPKEERFTVYMPGIYGYSEYEDGTLEVDGSYKNFSYEFVNYPSGVTIEEAKNLACDPYMSWVYYMGGERVDGSTVLTEDCTVVCVAEEADRAIPEFTVTIEVDGFKSKSYTYRGPVTMGEVVQKYCRETGIEYSDYIWDAEAVSFFEFTPIVYSRTIHAVLYTEPVKPTESIITLRRYDGVEETVRTYSVAYGMGFDEFVRQYLIPEYTYDTAFECEYAFYVGGDGNNEFTYATLEGNYSLWMIKRSVLQQGYNVSVDLTLREGGGSTEARMMYYPTNIRRLIWEVTGWELGGLDMYQVTINGTTIEYGGKEDFFYLTESKLYYTDMHIVVKPIFEIGVCVEVAGETSKSKTLTYYENVTPTQIAKDLGLSRGAFDYLWAYGWDSTSQDYIHPEEGLMMRFANGGACLIVTARKVVVGVSIIRANGEEMNFEPMIDSSSSSGWDWSVSVKTAAESWLGEEYADYNWRVKDSMGEREATLEDVLEFNYTENGASFDKKYTYYTLVGTPKKVMVEVWYTDENYNQTEIIDQEYDGGKTIGNILYEMGYRLSNKGAFYCTKDGVEYSFWVEGYDGNPLS